MPNSGDQPALQDAAPLRRRFVGTRRTGIAIVLLGLAVVVAGLYAGLFSPKPYASGRLAIAVIESVGEGGQPPRVSVPKPDGGRETVELLDPARSYELGGPVSVRVDRDDPTVVHDANGGRSGLWLLFVVAGLVLTVLGWYAGRAARRSAPRQIAVNEGISP